MPTDSLPLPDSAINKFTVEDIAWMAGILEGEGYFFFNANRLGIRVVMTDADIVMRFSRYWQVACRELKATAAHHKTPYSATLPSKKALQCIRLVRPFLGARRTSQVDEALAAFRKAREASRLKLRLSMQSFTDDQIVEAWNSRPSKESIRAFCRRLGGTGRKTVTARLISLGLMPGPPTTPPDSGRSDAPLMPVDLRQAPASVQSAWMAGLLDGEGSFRCRGGTVDVTLEMIDLDVVDRYASLAGVRSHQSAVRKHYKPAYFASACRPRGVAVMERILPFMGERRSARIVECLQQRAIWLARLQARRQAYRSKYEAQLPASELVLRWANRVPGETLRSFAREYGVHPQRMKDRLVQLGIYSSPVYKTRTSVTLHCEFCNVEFTRPATFTGKLCSMECSGRAQAQRRAAQRKAAFTAA